MELTITIKNVYGKETIYPVCDHAKGLAAFKGQKTLTESDIHALKKMGYSFKIASNYQNILENLAINQAAI